MIRAMSFRILIGLSVFFAASALTIAKTDTIDLLPTPTAKDKQLLESSQEIAKQITAIEWLGPMAPIALSPFFGLACLSGIATYGPEWLQQRSAIFGDSSPLNNAAIFWSMVVLTLVTSLPRLSKVSKPLALAAEKLEAYSVIIIVIAMRMFGSSDEGTSEAVSASAPIYLSAGITTLPMDIAVALASAVNILVINGVKLFCELVIWLTPIPFVDAMAEATNKVLCVGLMSLYCWSPIVATALNITLLAICACIYWWTQRRIVYYLDLLTGPILKGWQPWLFGENSDGETVFLAERWNGIPALTKLRLNRTPNDGWILTRHRWWNRIEYRLPASKPQTQWGLLAETVSLIDDSSQAVVVHRRLLSTCEHSDGSHHRQDGGQGASNAHSFRIP